MTTKAALRAQGLTARAALADRPARSAAACAHLLRWLAVHAPDAVLAGYVPIRGEADPRPALAAHRGPTCLPVVEGPARPLAFRLWRPGQGLEAGAFGTKQPHAFAEVIQPQVVIVPLAAFDRRGGRIGYGGGYYDRSLESLRAGGPVLALGFGFAAQQVETVPEGGHDQPLDLMVTEDGILNPVRS